MVELDGGHWREVSQSLQILWLRLEKLYKERKKCLKDRFDFFRNNIVSKKSLIAERCDIFRRSKNMLPVLGCKGVKMNLLSYKQFIVRTSIKSSMFYPLHSWLNLLCRNFVIIKANWHLKKSENRCRHCSLFRVSFSVLSFKNYYFSPLKGSTHWCLC